MDNTPHVKTWQDFPEFYNNPVIQKLAKNEKWTVSTTKSPDPTKKVKMPIDMIAWMERQQIWGAAYDRGYNPLVDLQTVCNELPTATNNAYSLDALVDKIVVLDIEPKCPDTLKQKFLQLPYLYAERSMSGQGLHLIFNLPEYLLDKYPNAKKKQALKDDNGYYEILLCHMVTFTRDVLPPSQCTGSIDDFDNVFELLASQAKESKTGTHAIITDIETDMIPYYDELMDSLSNRQYGKTIEDFPQKGNKTGYNNSSFEFGMSGFYYRALKRLLTNNTYKDHTYTDEEKAIIVYNCTKEHLAYRPKHDEVRSGMPWLLYVASCLIAKSDD